MAWLPSKALGWQQSLAPVLARWGTYCASHQIKVLLLDCLVLSALVCLVWPFDILPRIITSPSSSPASSSSALSARQSTDAAALWSHFDIDVSDSKPCWRATPKDRQVHAVQLRIKADPSAYGLSEHGLLDRQHLHQALMLQNAISEEFLHAQDWSCIPEPQTDTCLFISPLQPWQHAEGSLLSDQDVLDSLAALPFVDQVTGHLHRHHTKNAAETPFSADELSLYFFLQPSAAGALHSSNGAYDVNRVRQKLQAVAGGAGSLRPAASSSSLPGRLLLKPWTSATSSESSSSSIASWLDATIMGYALVAIYVGYTMRRMDRVHSRLGLLFTALVTMSTSTLLSLSVCKLLRFSVDAIPWKLIPLVITVLAVDNTFVLTHAVVSTPVEWSIPERVGQGLARVGPSIFLALVVEHLLLLAAWIFIPVRTVREMTLLAAVALKADAAMQITLFLPVLGIDIQRLELSDLLRLGDPHPYPKEQDEKKQQQQLSRMQDSSYVQLAAGIWEGAKDRIARTVTFLAVAFLNFGTYRKHGSAYFLPEFCKFSPDPVSYQTASPMWSALEPTHSASFVHLQVDEPYQLVLGGSPPSAVAALFSYGLQSTFRLAFHVLLPCAAFTTVLYFVLQQLLQDKEYLEAEKLRMAKERAEAARLEAEAKAPRARGRLLHCSTLADVELVASNRAIDAVMVSWSVMQPHITLHRPCLPVESSEPLHLELPEDCVALQHLVVDSDSRFCAAADRRGNVHIWDLKSTELVHIPMTANEKSQRKASIVGLYSGCAQTSDAPPKPGQAEKVKQRGVTFFAARSDGSISYWNCLDSSAGDSLDPPPSAPSKVSFLSVQHAEEHSASGLLLGRSWMNHPVELWQRSKGEHWNHIGSLTAQSGNGVITNLASTVLQTSTGNAQLIIASTNCGSVDVWQKHVDGLVCLGSFEAASTSISQMRLLSNYVAPCPCSIGQLSPGFLVACQAGDNLSLQHISAPLEPARCLCPPVSTTGAPMQDVGGPHKSGSAGPFNVSEKQLSKASESESSSSDENSPTYTSSSSSKRSPGSSKGSIRASSAGTSFLDEIGTPSTLDLRLGASRSEEVDQMGMWEPLPNTTTLCGIRRRTVDGVVSPWEIWSVDLSSSQRLSTACLTAPIPSEASSSSARSQHGQQDHPQLRQRKVSSGRRRREDPLECVGITASQEPAPQLLFSRIRSSAVTGHGIAASYGNAIVFIER